MNVCSHCAVFISKTSPWKGYHFTSEWPFTATRYVSRHMPVCGCKLGVVAGGGAHLLHATTCLVPAHREMRLFVCVLCLTLSRELGSFSHWRRLFQRSSEEASEGETCRSCDVM